MTISIIKKLWKNRKVVLILIFFYQHKSVMNKCVFLDRDGTINVEKNYLYKIKEFEWEYKAKEAIALIKEKGYKVIVVTNQSGIARGYYTEKDVIRLHQYLKEELEKVGTSVDDFYFCPHHPEGIGLYGIECDCRKPSTKMFEDAQKIYDIDFSKSYVVGDKKSDVDCAIKLGMVPILVMTGHGKCERKKIHNNISVFDNLYQFALEL